jgi:hypothetical protein
MVNRSTINLANLTLVNYKKINGLRFNRLISNGNGNTSYGK